MPDLEIKKLIDLNHEGGYWDFKRQWYIASRGLEDLLIDIICMANNLEDHDGLIIIGVDEDNGCDVVDIKSDANRKNTQQLVDFLKDKDFMGGVRPMVRVEHAEIDNKIIDVIIVENSQNTPFILTSSYRGIKAHHIYTRVQDVNTPRNQSADIDKVEYLFKKRFRINQSPLERAKYYLSDIEGWEKSSSRGDSQYYYMHSTDQFTIKFESDVNDERCEFWSLMFPDSGRHNNIRSVEILWNGLVLTDQYSYAPLDGGRASCVMPDVGSIQVNDKHYRYFYIVKGTLRYSLYEFLWQKEYNDPARYRSAIEHHFLIFENEIDLNKFKQSIEQNKTEISRELDEIHDDPENDHLTEPGFYYGFNERDKLDYLDSRYFVERYSV